MSDSKRTIEYVVEVIRKMPYQFTLSETEKFTSLLNERLDEILEIHKAESSDDVKTALMRAVINGTPLPKGHGRIIDESKITSCEWDGFLKIMITNAPTIIEAHNEVEDGND